MREILFRGKATNRIEGREYRTKYKNGDWVYGLLTDVENYAGFSEMTNTNGVSGIDVDKNTVGQFTGLTDKNGKKIFEGDILHFKAYRGGGFACPIGTDIYYRVLFGHCNPDMNTLTEYVGFWALGKNYDEDDLYEYGSSISYLVDSHGACVVGNIHDNPELLKGGAEK